jgi:iron complex outermembrane receptor protein
MLSSIGIAAASCHAEQIAEKPAAAADARESPDPTTLGTVVVTATRLEQPSFTLPLSIDLIGRQAIQHNNAMVNLSEPLARVPGIVAQNRQNYAQDLQISSRGFGARSSFGVRGIRLYADGIPATMPDGQGQTSNFDLSSADRIEVLRGPFSALYGNSSGGVIAVFTEDGKPGLSISPFIQFGSYGTEHYGIKAAGQRGIINYVLAASRFDTSGYREHSAATRDSTNAKIGIALGADAVLTLIGNTVAMPDIQDPLGLTRSQFQSNPRGVDQSALLFNTRKSVSQQQLGLSYEKSVTSADSINAILYGGHRATTQYQAIPIAAQLAATSAGGVIDLFRQYGGADVRWTRRTDVGTGRLQWSAGVSYDNLDEDRRGYENFAASVLGVRGRLRRDEKNRVYNIDEYFQAQWEPDPQWLLLAGIRNSNIRIASEDHYIAPGNGNDSGSVRYQAVNPVFGATFKMSGNINLYASYGKGFETPTLNELSYRAADAGGAGFNFALQPARSNNFEAGIKAIIAGHLRVNLAAFHIDTDNELAVLSNSGGRAVYQNAGKTRRDGIELTLEGNWPNGIGMLWSYSQLRAVYAESFCSGSCSAATRVPAGNRIPGVPDRTLYGELSWRSPASGFAVALEGKYGGKIYVDDINSDAASAYFVANLRMSLEQKAGSWLIRELVRVDNIAGREYIGSVIVNESNQRFFEPAPGRNYLIGVTASYAW